MARPRASKTCLVTPGWRRSKPACPTRKPSTVDNSPSRRIRRTAGSWAVADASQSDYPVDAIHRGTGLGTVAPFTTGHDLSGSAYWQYDPNGHLGLYTGTPPSFQWSGANFTATVNGGNPIWALTFRGTDDSSWYDGFTASLLFGGLGDYGISQATWDTISERLQAMDRGMASSWPSNYWCDTPNTYVRLGLYPSVSSGGQFARIPAGGAAPCARRPPGTRAVDGAAIRTTPSRRPPRDHTPSSTTPTTAPRRSLRSTGIWTPPALPSAPI